MFAIRKTKPEKGNKFYITKGKGGYSTCIQGSPTDANCNVLSNCVGYACGRFNEIIGTMKYPSLNCNAENFIERAKKLGLEISTVPTLGGIMVWAKGKARNSSDGAGHVAVVERIDSANQIYTSESSWGGKAFFNATRKNSNKRWGLGTGYTFRGCIVNPTIGKVVWEEPKKEEPKQEEPKKEVVWEPKVGDYVVPIRLIDYKGRGLIQWDKKYQISSISADTAVLRAVRGTQRPIWARLKLKNLKKVG